MQIQIQTALLTRAEVWKIWKYREVGRISKVVIKNLQKNQSKSRDKKQLTSALRDCFPKLAPGAVQNSRWEHQKTCSQCLGLSPSPPSSKSRWVRKPGNYTKPFCFGASYKKESFKTCTHPSLVIPALQPLTELCSCHKCHSPAVTSLKPVRLSTFAILQI